MDPLRDIHDIDPASWWPPAPGWWLIVFGFLLSALLIWWLLRQRKLYPLGRWQKDARRRLLQLKRQLKHASTKEVASELSELLRRIAIARCGRSKTAALTGHKWLAWLHNNDRSGFDWLEHGQLLLHLPYAPPHRDGVVPREAGRHERPPELETHRTTVGLLIDAAIHWVSEEACHV